MEQLLSTRHRAGSGADVSALGARLRRIFDFPYGPRSPAHVEEACRAVRELRHHLQGVPRVSPYNVQLIETPRPIPAKLSIPSGPVRDVLVGLAFGLDELLPADGLVEGYLEVLAARDGIAFGVECQASAVGALNLFRETNRRVFKLLGISDKLLQQPVDTGVAICYLGERQYSVGNRPPVTVSENEDSVLRAFVDHPSMDTPALVEAAGFERAPRVLRELRKKYEGLFEQAIRAPGNKGAGGYRAIVIRDESHNA